MYEQFYLQLLIQEKWKYVHTKDYTGTSSFVHNNPRLETIQRFIMDEQWVVHLYKGLVSSSKEKRITDTTVAWIHLQNVRLSEGNKSDTKTT